MFNPFKKDGKSLLQLDNKDIDIGADYVVSSGCCCTCIDVGTWKVQSKEALAADLSGKKYSASKSVFMNLYLPMQVFYL